jgi:hypothetical protein
VTVERRVLTYKGGKMRVKIPLWIASRDASCHAFLINLPPGTFSPALEQLISKPTSMMHDAPNTRNVEVKSQYA